MLNLGNGEHSAARCFHHFRQLHLLFEELGGIQQLGTGPDARPPREIREAEDDFEITAQRFIRELADDLGVRIKIK